MKKTKHIICLLLFMAGALQAQVFPADSTQRQQTLNLIGEADTIFRQLGVMVMQYLPKLIIGLLLFYFGFKAVNKAMGLLDKWLQKSNFDKDLRPFMVGIVRMVFKFIIAISAAGIMGVETTSFVALLAAAGFAIGLAFQGSLSNFAGGILILLFKPFKTGDLIAINDYMGRVKEIQILYTVLETLSRRRVVIPNSILSNGSGRKHNGSRHYTHRPCV